MEAKRAAGIIIYELQEQTFLMGLRADGQGWGFAAGKQEKSDRSLINTALRELKEELGVVLPQHLRKKVRFHKTILCKYNRIDKETHTSSRHTILSDIFYLEIENRCEINCNHAFMDGEVTDIRWFSLKDLIDNANIFMPSLIALNTLNLDFSYLN